MAGHQYDAPIDPHISPLNTIAYYTAMNRVMGDAEVQQFARLYLFPGGDHCGGGEGPFSFDLLSAIMAWVERGAAPFALVASHQQGGAGNDQQRETRALGPRVAHIGSLKQGWCFSLRVRTGYANDSPPNIALQCNIDGTIVLGPEFELIG